MELKKQCPVRLWNWNARQNRIKTHPIDDRRYEVSISDIRSRRRGFERVHHLVHRRIVDQECCWSWLLRLTVLRLNVCTTVPVKTWKLSGRGITGRVISIFHWISGSPEISGKWGCQPNRSLYEETSSTFEDSGTHWLKGQWRDRQTCETGDQAAWLAGIGDWHALPHEGIDKDPSRQGVGAEFGMQYEQGTSGVWKH